jgi:hypothetical protein
MKPFVVVGVIALIGILPGIGLAEGNGPVAMNVDQKISIRAEDVTLGNLLRLWDQATGMHSTVPAELKNTTLSVSFAALSVNDALRKIFDGRPFGYVATKDQVVVTPRASSEPVAETEPLPGAADEQTPEVSQERVMAETVRMKPPPPEPTYIPTPFGMIVSPPGVDRPFIQLPPTSVPPSPPFFLPMRPPVPPAGAPNGPLQNNLFAPTPLYRQ